MKPLSIVGLVLIVVGIAGLVLGRFSYTTEEKVLEVGPLVATAQEEHAINIPDVAIGKDLEAGINGTLSASVPAGCLEST